MSDFMFDESMIKSVMLDTLRKRLWGCWMVLSGRAGIIFFGIPKKKIYPKVSEA